jgi:hypothetical protein
LVRNLGEGGGGSSLGGGGGGGTDFLWVCVDLGLAPGRVSCLVASIGGGARSVESNCVRLLFDDRVGSTVDPGEFGGEVDDAAHEVPEVE